MEGRCAAIQRLGKSKSIGECGLWWLPEDVVLKCLARLSRLDLAAVAMTCESYRSLVADPYIWDLRYAMGFTKLCLYVCLHIGSELRPQWFVFHPVQRRLKPIYQPWFWTLLSCCFVVIDGGIFHIGGLINGKPSRDITYFDCSEHKCYVMPPMKMARASASACVIDGKIYVFGGCGDEADSSNWAEVYNINKQTWDFVSLPTRPNKNIQQSVGLNMNEFYAVDEDAHIFSFSPTKAETRVVSKPGEATSVSRDDWCTMGGFLFSRGPRGTLLWCLPHELDWKEVEGLKDDLQHLLRQSHIIKLSAPDHAHIVIFWIAPPGLELFSAEISLNLVRSSERLMISGKIEWSGAVYKLTDPVGVQVLFAGSAFI